MIVVSDTSPLNYLVLLGAVDVLPQLFGEVHCPPAVLQELHHPRAPQSVRNWAKQPPAWLHVKEPRSTTPEILLDPGEAAAIRLAIELGADAVLIDEKKGRHFARSHGLATLGTITVLELAAERDLLNLNSALTALQQTTFHITQPYIDAALARDAERRSQG